MDSGLQCGEWFVVRVFFGFCHDDYGHRADLQNGSPNRKLGSLCSSKVLRCESSSVGFQYRDPDVSFAVQRGFGRWRVDPIELRTYCLLEFTAVDHVLRFLAELKVFLDKEIVLQLVFCEGVSFYWSGGSVPAVRLDGC